MKSQLKDANEAIVKLMAKVDKYKEKSDQYDEIIALIEIHKKGKQAELVAQTLDHFMIDPENPTVTIMRYQYERIKNLNDANMVTREILDFLFEPEAYRGKTFTVLREQYECKINALRNYVINRFPNAKAGTISKTITNKSRGK